MGLSKINGDAYVCPDDVVAIVPNVNQFSVSGFEAVGLKGKHFEIILRNGKSIWCHEAKDIDEVYEAVFRKTMRPTPEPTP